MRRNMKQTVALAVCFALSASSLNLCVGVNSNVLQVQASEMEKENQDILQEDTVFNEGEQFLQKTVPDKTETLRELNGAVAVDANNFPDERFREYLSEKDADSDGSLSAEERENVTEINIWGKPVKDLTGISFFPNLVSISIGESLLVSVDLSQNANLQSVNFSMNEKLQTINLEGCSNLTSISLSGSALSELDLSGCPNLNSLDCNSNQIAVLDLNQVPNLTMLSVSDNQLTELNLKAVPELVYLNCLQNKLQILDVSANKKLKTLSCDGNSLEKIDVTGLLNLESLSCSNSRLTELDVTKNTNLQSLQCGYNPLKKLDISNNLQLESLDINETYITSLDASKNELLKIGYMGYWNTGSISGVVSETENGKWLFSMFLQEGFQPEKLKVVDWNDDSNIPEITEQGVVWTKNPSENGVINLSLEYDLSNGSYLDGKTLRCNYLLRRADAGYDETYVALTAENFPDEAFRNFLTEQYDWDRDGKFQPGVVSELWISGVTELKDLTGIEYFKVLSKLYLMQNPALSKLDVSRNEKLTTLHIDGSSLHCLDLRNNPQIQEMNLYNVPLTSLYLAEGSMLGRNLSGWPITVTAVQENGRYVLDLSEYGGLDQKRIVELSDGEMDGDKIYWDSASELPLTFSYKFLLRKDYETGMEYSDMDVLTVNFSLTNNAPELPEGRTIELTAENFPSASLLDYLKENFDYDKDGQVNTGEITYINLFGSGVDSLAGIEHLNCLQTLYVYDAPFQSLDLSSNPALTSLSVTGGSLTDINISGCPYLEEIDLGRNSLTQIDISKNTYLRRLSSYENSLTVLDVSKNLKLNSLNIRENAIAGLDLAGNSKLQSLDCSYNPRMTELELPLQKEKIEEIHVIGTKLNSFTVDEMPNLKVLEIDSNQGGITELDLSNNISLKFLTANDLSVKANWEKMTALESLAMYDWESRSVLEKLDLSNAKDLNWCNIGMSSLKELDVHGCAKLRWLSAGSSLQKINLEGCTALAELDCRNNELISLDVSDCVALKALTCSDNKLETLDVTHNTALQSLYCDQNKLTTIDTAKNPALKWFTCSDNPIVSLDLSNNKAMLTDLTCINGALTSLDAAENEVLENVQLDNQVFEASEEDFQQEPVTRIKGEDLPEEQRNAVNVRGAVSEKYILNLARYGKFDPGKVKNLSSGKAVTNGIMWEDAADVPAEVAYEYDISNNYKLSGRTMPVTIKLGESSSDDSSQSQKKSISSCSVTVNAASCIYNGKPQEPGITVKDGNYVLKPGTDYSVSYENHTNAGNASAVINGMGNYTGSVRQGFTIGKASQVISCNKSYSKPYGSKAFSLKAKRTVGNGTLSYSSSNKKIAAVDNKGKVSLKGTGIATITIKAASTNNYNEKSVKVTVSVNPKKQALKSVKTLKGKKLSVSWKKDTKATGYQIQYSINKNFKKGVKTIKVKKAKNTSVTVKKLKVGQKYYLRVRSYKTVKVSGKTKVLYGAWSKIKQSKSITK